MVRRSVVLMAAALAAPLVTAQIANADPPAPAAVSSLATTAPANCNFGANSFAYAPSALQSCGYDAWPLTSTTALPGGGEAYAYDEGSGDVVTTIVPPSSFQPLTATAAQLAEYGFPPRPAAGTPTYTDWFKEMSVYKGPAPAEPEDISDPKLVQDTDYGAN